MLMSMALATRRGEPLGEINPTPLIDVLLVLLVMLILALPPTTNTLSYPLPSPIPGPPADPIKNTVTVTTRDTIAWNGEPVSERQLAGALAHAAALRPEPELLVAPEAGASYDASVHVLNLIKQSGVSNVGFVGNERYRTFGTGGPKNPIARES
jgi:biopolymer transport protein ExbD